MKVETRNQKIELESEVGTIYRAPRGVRQIPPLFAFSALPPIDLEKWGEKATPSHLPSSSDIVGAHNLLVFLADFYCESGVASAASPRPLDAIG